jgi:hypothetical protein
MFWDGDKPLPEIAADTCMRALDAGYIVRVLTAADIPDTPGAVWAKENKRWCILSEIARHYCIMKWGGIYMDTDVEWRDDPMPHVDHMDWFCTSESPRFLNAAVSGGVAGNSFSAQMHHTLATTDYDNILASIDIPLESYVGPHMLTMAMNKMTGLRLDRRDCLQVVPIKYEDFDGAVMPEWLFFGVGYIEYHQKLKQIPHNAVLVHHWAKSW